MAIEKKNRVHVGEPGGKKKSHMKVTRQMRFLPEKKKIFAGGERKKVERQVPTRKKKKGRRGGEDP